MISDRTGKSFRIFRIAAGCAAAFLFWAGAAVGQETGQPGVEDVAVRMKAELHLTEQQTDAVRDVLRDYMTKTEELQDSLRERGITNEVTIKREQGELQQEEDAKMARILTPEQQARWREKQEIKQRLNDHKVDFTDNQWQGSPGSSGRLGPSIQY